ncbi:unnamed protein product [Plutella xylostella]|uniref:(diamondback moth) hypothetical protein n=1 Tax=Plutella xylostella TaxID=51655 RepID=A0A8S4D772_PLUXY|nr:unnamed protein product [Plutella xylostella]
MSAKSGWLACCNKTYYGDIGRTYELELHRPREDLVPYVCLLTITAAGGVHGDLVQSYQHRPREDLVCYECLLTITAASGVHGDLVQICTPVLSLPPATLLLELNWTKEQLPGQNGHNYSRLLSVIAQESRWSRSGGDREARLPYVFLCESSLMLTEGVEAEAGRRRCASEVQARRELDIINDT